MHCIYSLTIRCMMAEQNHLFSTTWVTQTNRSPGTNSQSSSYPSASSTHHQTTSLPGSSSSQQFTDNVSSGFTQVRSSLPAPARQQYVSQVQLRHSNSNSVDSDDGEDTVEGYSCQFVDTEDACRYECSICLQIQRNTVQTNCGHRFCEACLVRWMWKTNTHVCPECKNLLPSHDEHQYFPDKFARREVLSLMVYCQYEPLGCTKQVELRNKEDHEAICDFGPAICPQCAISVPKKELQIHTEKECKYRIEMCMHCSARITYAELEDHHKYICDGIMAACDSCGQQIIKRLMSEHHQTTCPKCMVECKFSEFGCSAVVERETLEKHKQEQIVQHMELLRQTLSNLVGVGSLTGSSSVARPASASHTPLYNRIASQLMDAANNTQLPPPLTHANSIGTLPVHKDVDTPGSGSSSGAGGSRRPTCHPLSSLRSLSLNLPNETADCSANDLLQPAENTLPQDMERRELVVLQETNERQRQTIDQQRILLANARLDNCMLYRAVEDMQTVLAQMQERSFCHGVYTWHITDYARHRTQARQASKPIALHSQGFYTSPCGYKMCMRLNLSGVDTGFGTHVSLFVHVLSGEHDSILDWPFKGSIQISIMDQSHNSPKQHISELMITKEPLAAFDRPTSSRNAKGFGYVQFARLALIDAPNSPYIINDTLCIKAEVKEGIR